MKNLRSFFVLIMISLIFLGCSDDSADDSNNEANLIIGTWKYVESVNVCSTGAEKAFEYDTCEQQSRIVFSNHNNPDLQSDGTITITENHLDNGNCNIDYNETGTWSLSGDNLTIIIQGRTSSPTVFELTKNTLRIGYYDSDPNDPCDGGNLPSHYYTELTKVK